MAARINAPRIWVRLRFTAVTVAQSGAKRKIEKGKLKFGTTTAKEPARRRRYERLG